MNMRPTKFGVGQSVKRVEDIRLVSGRGNYASDAVDKAELKAVFLRSPYGHAKFRIDDLEAARAAPGVRAVYVASDFADLGDLPCLAPVANADGSNTPLKPYPVMASDEAQHVGDIVAMVVADTALQARDAAELISVDMGRASRRRPTWKRPSGRSAARLRRRARQRRLRHPYRRQSRRRTRRSPAQRTRFASRSSTRAWSPTIWSRAPPLANMIAQSGRFTLNARKPGRARHSGRDRQSDPQDPARIPSRRHPGRGRRLRHQGRRLSRISARSRGGAAARTDRSAGSPIAASISSATRKAATM